MPFLLKRIRENLTIFFVMGIAYFVAYNIIAKFPDNAETVFVSCAGFVAVAMIVYCRFLRSYLLSIDDVVVYAKTNMAAYGIYVAVFYLLFAFDALLGGGRIYSVLFMPYDVITVFGANRFVSTIFVHILFFVLTLILPYFVRKQEYERYPGI